MRSMKRGARRSADSDEKKPFWSISRVFFAIVVLVWVLSILVLFRQREWKGEAQRAVVIVENGSDEIRRPLTLVILKPDKKVFVLPVPPEQRIETPFNYGTFTSDALVGLTQLEELRWEYLLYTLSLEYGVVFDGVIWRGASAGEGTDLSSLRGVAWSTLMNRQPSTLAWWDRMTFWRQLQQVPSYQIQTVNLNEYLDEEKVLNATRYDRWAELYLQDAGIRGSGFSIAVQNGSGIEGYAGRLGRMLSLIGYDLRSVETIDTQDTSELIWPENLNEQQAFAQGRLEKLLKPFSVRRENELPEQSRSNGVIRLGRDQATLFRLHR